MYSIENWHRQSLNNAAADAAIAGEFAIRRWFCYNGHSNQGRTIPMKKNNKPGSQSAAFVSLGCFKNTVDSEVLAGMLQER